MTTLPSHLGTTEQAGILEFARRLHNYLGNDLCHLWLFGSKARGDFSPDSDTDILIVMMGPVPERRGVIHRMGANVSLDYDIIINTHIIEKERWDKIVRYQDTLWREVQRDGIPLSQPLLDSLTA